MIAIKIDVVKKDCYLVEYETRQDIYKHLECSIYERVPFIEFASRDELLVDEAGRLRETPLGVFRFFGLDETLFGHGLLIGQDREGNYQSVDIDLYLIKNLVQFGIIGFQ